jgi:hypothetical protein
MKMSRRNAESERLNVGFIPYEGGKCVDRAAFIAVDLVISGGVRPPMQVRIFKESFVQQLGGREPRVTFSHWSSLPHQTVLISPGSYVERS